MPIRATKRGVQRTPLDTDADVVVCGASFAGLTVARELAGHASRPRVLMVDRYEVGERQTSACAAPTEWLEHLGLAPSIQQTFGDLVVHARDRTFRWELPFTFSTFDYRRLCQLLLDGCDARFETAKVDGRTGDVVHTDRGDLRAPLIVDALGWRRVLDDDERIQPPEARLSRGLEIHPHAAGPGPRALARPALRPRRLLLVVPRGRRAARRRRVLRPARPRPRADGAPRGRRRRPGRALAGQLDPAPDPPRDGRRRLLRRRQRRALPPDDRRGHPARVPLRARARPRAACRARRRADPRAGARALRRVLRRAPLEVRRAPARAGRRRQAQPAPARDAPGAHRAVAAEPAHLDVPPLPQHLPARGGCRSRRRARRLRPRGLRRGA